MRYDIRFQYFINEYYRMKERLNGEWFSWRN